MVYKGRYCCTSQPRKGLKSRTSLTMLTAFLRRASMSLEMRRRSATSSVSRISSPVRSSLYSVDTSSFCRVVPQARAFDTKSRIIMGESTLFLLRIINYVQSRHNTFILSEPSNPAGGHRLFPKSKKMMKSTARSWPSFTTSYLDHRKDTYIAYKYTDTRNPHLPEAC